jgi:HK97 gp10 family phage protein
VRKDGTLMAKITGIDAVQARIRSLSGPEVVRQLGAALFNAGEAVAAEASQLITEGSASGTSGGKHQHVPSRPGEPPNNDTGHLKANIEVVQVEPLKVVVSSNAEYSRALEFGTSKMAARPFMGPAADRTRKDVSDTMQRAVQKIINGQRIVP